MESQDAELSGSVITFDDTVEEGAAAQPTPRSALSESAKNDFPTKESRGSSPFLEVGQGYLYY